MPGTSLMGTPACADTWKDLKIWPLAPRNCSNPKVPKLHHFRWLGFPQWAGPRPGPSEGPPEHCWMLHSDIFSTTHLVVFEHISKYIFLMGETELHIFCVKQCHAYFLRYKACFKITIIVTRLQSSVVKGHFNMFFCLFVSWNFPGTWAFFFKLLLALIKFCYVLHKLYDSEI